MNKLKIDYEKACNAYLQALIEAWGLDMHYGYWIAEEVGGIYDYDGGFTINMYDIIYCVENNVTEMQYMEWLDYCVEANEFNLPTPNLKSWMHGCPRTSPDTFKHFRDLRDRLNKAVDQERERFAPAGE